MRCFPLPIPAAAPCSVAKDASALCNLRLPDGASDLLIPPLRGNPAFGLHALDASLYFSRQRAVFGP